MTETQKEALYELTLDSLLDQMYYMEETEDGEGDGPNPPSPDELAELKEDISDAVQEVINKFLQSRSN